MKFRFGSALAALALLLIGSIVFAHANYIGYSGAPGSSGRCAASCHGGSSGTVAISGFPTEYTPGQVYTITISHGAGGTIRQFNGSCRVGSGSTNAGVISAGTSTVTYSTSGETNGVHLTSESLDSGTFDWTAPGAGTGGVTLYIAGHQGSYSGGNTNLQLTATEMTTGVPDPGAVRIGDGLLLAGNYPEPFASSTAIEYVLPQAAVVSIEVYDQAGRLLAWRTVEQSPGEQRFVWDGSAFPSGVYFYRIQAGALSEVRKMLLLK